MAGSSRNTVALLLAATTLAACSDSGSEDAEDAEDADSVEVDDPLVVLDIELLVGRESVVFFASERDRPCDCSNRSFPTPGQCTILTDYTYCDCEPAPASCLREMRVEREGQVIASQAYDPGSLGLGSMAVPELASSTGNELVLEGCGATARIPLPQVSLGEPVVTRISHDDEEVTFHWEADGAETGLGTMGRGFGADACHGDQPGETRVPLVVTSLGWPWAHFTAVAGGDTVETPLGRVRVWQIRDTELADVMITGVLDNGRLFLSQPDARLTFDTPIDPAGPWDDEPEVIVEYAELDVSVDPPLLGVRALLGPHFVDVFEYRAGPTEDRVAIIEPHRSRSAVIPHVEASGDFALGRALREGELNTLDVEVGPIVLEPDGEGPQLELGFSLHLEMPTISEPAQPR
jgi:hypothetical protein